MSLLELDFRVMGCAARLLLADRAPGTEPSPGLVRRAAEARALLDSLDARWSRFAPGSDVAALAGDGRRAVHAHPHVRALVRAGAWAGRASGGLVDITLADELAQAGYAHDWRRRERAALPEALAAAPRRARAAAHPEQRWRALGVDEAAGTVHRPPGVALDSGGLGKGLAADLVAQRLTGLRYVVDVGGDLAIGHGGRGPMEIAVEDPCTGAVAHRLSVAAGGVATSGIHRRLWFGADGRPAHHLLDPATGRPAWTGLISATAVADSALQAEVLAKVALLAGPEGGRRALAGARGGVLIHEGGRVEVVCA
jgi:thiamine biosynthesis lipoprotein